MEQHQIEIIKNALIELLASLNNERPPGKLIIPETKNLDPSESLVKSLTRIQKHQQLYLKRVRETLQRIEAKSYGRCRHCNKEIEKVRLMANPLETLCERCDELTWGQAPLIQ